MALCSGFPIVVESLSLVQGIVSISWKTVSHSDCRGGRKCFLSQRWLEGRRLLGSDRWLSKSSALVGLQNHKSVMGVAGSHLWVHRQTVENLCESTSQLLSSCCKLPPSLEISLLICLRLASALTISSSSSALLDVRWPWRRIDFQWFFIALSVLPVRLLAMVAHLLPWSLWAWMMAESFSAVNGWCCTIAGGMPSLIYQTLCGILGEWGGPGILRSWAIMRGHKFGDLF